MSHTQSVPVSQVFAVSHTQYKQSTLCHTWLIVRNALRDTWPTGSPLGLAFLVAVRGGEDALTTLTCTPPFSSHNLARVPLSRGRTEKNQRKVPAAGEVWGPLNPCLRENEQLNNTVWALKPL